MFVSEHNKLGMSRVVIAATAIAIAIAITIANAITITAADDGGSSAFELTPITTLSLSSMMVVELKQPMSILMRGTLWLTSKRLVRFLDVSTMWDVCRFI